MHGCVFLYVPQHSLCKPVNADVCVLLSCCMNSCGGVLESENAVCVCVCVCALQTGRLSLDNGESEGSGLLLLLVFWLSARQTEGESLIVWHRGRRRETRDEQF